MGTWAEGNFNNDAAMDFVADIAREIAKEMSAPEEVEDIDLVMAAVAMTKALVEHCRAPRPKVAEIASLKVSVLSLFDEKIDGLAPAPDHKIARREVIEQTFNELLELLAG